MVIKKLKRLTIVLVMSLAAITLCSCSKDDSKEESKQQELEQAS